VKVFESGAPKIKLAPMTTPATVLIVKVPLRTAPSSSVPDKLKVVPATARDPHIATITNVYTILRFQSIRSPPGVFKVGSSVYALFYRRRISFRRDSPHRNQTPFSPPITVTNRSLGLL